MNPGLFKARLTPILLLALVLAPLPAVPGTTRDERLNHGDVIIDTHPMPGHSLPEVVVTAVIDAPPARVWQIIDHCGDYQRTMLRVKMSRELTRVGEVVRCESIIEMPWPWRNLHGITVAHHIVTPGRWLREWTLESGDYKVNRGHWLLTPWGADGKRTLAEYDVFSQPNVSIPFFIQKLAMQVVLPDLMKKLRTETR